MKKIIAIIALLLCINSYAQKGVGGIGRLMTTFNYKSLDTLTTFYNPKSFQLSIGWDDLKPDKNSAYVWAPFDTAMARLVRKGLYIGVMCYTGQNAPAWVKTDAGSFIISADTFPDYHNATYKSEYLQFQHDVADHFATLPDAVKAKFKYYQVTNGTTGDWGPYHGTPASQYQWTDDAWSAYVRTTWVAIAGYQAQNSAWLRLMFNTGSNAKDLNYVLTTFATAYTKEAAWVEYGLDGEGLNPRPPYFSRAESEDYLASDHHKKEGFAACVAASAYGLSIFNIGAWVTNMIEEGEVHADVRMTNFFNRYANQHTLITASRGFVQLGDRVDFLDTVRFPVEQYGAVITPSTLSAYNFRINQINADVTGGAHNHAYLKVMAQKANINPTRITNIRAVVPTANYSTTDAYLNDFIYGGRAYAVNVTQAAPNETSVGRYRVGADSTMYGRYGRQWKFVNGSGEMFFDIDDNLKVSGQTNYVQIAVTYYDSSTTSTSWCIRAYDSIKKKTVRLATITNGNTRKWKTVYVTTSLAFTNKMQNASDFSLKYLKGNNTVFTLVEVANLTKEAFYPGL